MYRKVIVLCSKLPYRSFCHDFLSLVERLFIVFESPVFMGDGRGKDLGATLEVERSKTYKLHWTVEHLFHHVKSCLHNVTFTCRGNTCLRYTSGMILSSWINVTISECCVQCAWSFAWNVLGWLVEHSCTPSNTLTVSHVQVNSSLMFHGKSLMRSTGTLS